MIARPRGTEDVLPEAAGRWQALESICRDLCRRYAFGEVRTPAFELSEVFKKSLGEATDVVQKETYDFTDRGGRRLTLRPEGTAPVVRAVLQSGLLGGEGPRPLKLYYLDYAAFRYERPQSGRLRQFHQFGCEVFGSASPVVDAELIALVADLLDDVGVRGWSLRLNSIGDEQCRPAYREALRAYYQPLLPGLCADCQRRFDANPLRLLDCKLDREAVAGAPRSSDHLCADCAAHFDALQGHLDDLGIPYTVDHSLVRGFDYYARTVFEFVHGELGAQNSILGGGRYDGLVAASGGKPTPAAGFAVGMERLLSLLGAGFGAARGVDVFIAAQGDASRRDAVPLAHRLRRAGLAVESDLLERSLKAQLRAASKLRARCCVIIGDQERERGVVKVRDMERSREEPVPLDGLEDALLRRLGKGHD